MKTGTSTTGLIQALLLLCIWSCSQNVEGYFVTMPISRHPSIAKTLLPTIARTSWRRRSQGKLGSATKDDVSSSSISPSDANEAGIRISQSLSTATTTTHGPRWSHYDSVIVGGGPAGLLAAIMLSRKFGPNHRIAVCEQRPAIPPKPDDEQVWGDVARFYLLGIGLRGQTALKEFDVYDDFEKASIVVEGRRSWESGLSGEEDSKITPNKREVTTRVLPRDKLVGVLHHHLLDNYSDAKIDLLYGYQVDPTDFGPFDCEVDDENDVVSLSISKCQDATPRTKAATVTPDSTPTYVASQEAEETCDVDDQPILVTSNLVIGADGSARTVANSIEQKDGERFAKINPLLRPFAKNKPFRVTRYVDDNPIVYKSVPINMPPHWPGNLNYSQRSREGRVTLEALPSSDRCLCALLLLKPGDELAQANCEPKAMREFFDKEFPQFGALIPDEEMGRLATKPASTLPAFRYVGPRLNMGRRTIVLGDAAHTVKPYFGLGCNTALEDVQILSQAIDASIETSSCSGAEGKTSSKGAIPKAVQLFSDDRATEAKALVQISRNMDQPGKLRVFLLFVLPLILDGIFHKMAPKIFGPNMFGMFATRGLRFRQMQRKKRLDRSLQVLILGSMMTGIGWGFYATIGVLARLTGQSRLITTAATAFIVGVGTQLKKSKTTEASKA